MKHELDVRRYEEVRPLFDELAAYYVSIPALFDGVNPGRIFVDDPTHPQAALIQSVEGYHLAGGPTNAAFIADLNLWLQETYFNDDVTVEGGAFYACVHPDTWAQHMADIFAPRTVFIHPRRHYVCTELAYRDWREHVPSGFSVQRIDDPLLDAPELDIPGHIRSWIRYNWGSRENYRAHGFGFCTLYGDQVVSWSVADCASGSRCEIGIQTRPEYRRRGLAATTAAACVDFALTNGFTEVGWHCDEDNNGSWKTAEKVGFRKERDYAMFFCFFSRAHELAESGMNALKTGQYAQAAAAYAQLLALSDAFPPYIYFDAARAQAATEHPDEATRLLHAAVDRGWTNREVTERCPEFDFLHRTPAWADVLARMQAQP
ncbi:MAG: GNAT family N-acetyltransferase [Anaerolineae bacterium]|nr:GNAT family N-acetyltransferase [Anaerolineae bacterium]